MGNAATADGLVCCSDLSMLASSPQLPPAWDGAKLGAVLAVGSLAQLRNANPCTRPRDTGL